MEEAATGPSTMDWVWRAIEAGKLTPADIAEIREAFQEVLRDEGVPVRESNGSNAGGMRDE